MEFRDVIKTIRERKDSFENLLLTARNTAYSEYLDLYADNTHKEVLRRFNPFDSAITTTMADIDLSSEYEWTWINNNLQGHHYIYWTNTNLMDGKFPITWDMHWTGHITNPTNPQPFHLHI